MKRSPCEACGKTCQGRFCLPCYRARISVPVRRCVDCGCEVRRTSVRCRRCAGTARRAPREHGSGYLRVFAPGHSLASRDGYAFAHRLVLHKAGVEIPPGHHVHHLNGDKRDNRLENLAVLSPQEHSQLHADATEEFTNQFGTFKRKATA